MTSVSEKLYSIHCINSYAGRHYSLQFSVFCEISITLFTLPRALPGRPAVQLSPCCWTLPSSCSPSLATVLCWAGPKLLYLCPELPLQFIHSLIVSCLLLNTEMIPFNQPLIHTTGDELLIFKHSFLVFPLILFHMVWRGNCAKLHHYLLADNFFVLETTKSW